MTLDSELTVMQLLPALDNGGVERSTLEIARALVAAGHRSIVISGGGRQVRRLIAEGSEHVELPIGRKSLGVLMRVRRLRQIFDEMRPDIIHARSRLPAWLGRIALRESSRARFITTVHGLNSPSRYSAVMASGERVICVSNTVRDYVLKNYPGVDSNRLVVIPRGVDPTEFPYGYRPSVTWRDEFFAAYPLLVGAPLLTLPGRGTRLKGHSDAIRLLADLEDRGVDARLLLLGVREPGRDDYIAELAALARQLGVADKLVMSAPRSDVREVLAISDLVLQLSTRPEAFGRTVIEALSLCRPVLGYAHGGVGELLTELYPAGRVAPGATARLAERAAELLNAAPPITPLTQYRLTDMQAATLALYESLAPRV